MVKEINKIQKLQFELMKEASFNEFNGEKIVKSLKNHKELWKGVVMTRAGYNMPDADDYTMALDLICLRDIGDECWNVDTVFILIEENKGEELQKLAETWGANEISWLSKKDVSRFMGTSQPNGQVLKVWWD